MRAIRKSAPVLFLLLVSCAFLWEAAFFRKAFFYFDIIGFNLPMRQFLGERLREGIFPLWSAGKFCGFPVFAEGQGGFLYPPNLLLFPFLTAWKAFNISMILNFFLGSSFMFFYLKRKVATAPAILASLVYAYNGYFLCHSFHTAQVNVAIWLPLLFLFSDRALEGGGIRPVVLGACVLAVMLFAGHPNACMVSLAGLAFYIFFRGLFSGRVLICILVIVLIVLLGVGLAAVQLLPMAELAEHSQRIGRFPYDLLTYGSFSPAFFSTLLMPNLFGNRASDTVWFPPVFPYHEMDVYLGILPLLLLIITQIHFRSRRELIWFALWITSIILILGRYTPFYHLFSYLPYFNRMRLPCKFNLLFCFSSSVLVAFGAERLFGWRKIRLLPIAAGVLAAAVLAAAVYYVTYDGIFQKLGNIDPSRIYPGWMERLGRLRLLITSDLERLLLFLVIGFSIIIAVKYRFANRKLLAVISVIFILVDLFLFSRSRIALIEPSIFTDEPPTVASLEGDETVFRIYNDDISERYSYISPGWLNDKKQYFYSLYTLPPDTQVLFGIPSIRGGSPLILRRMARALSGYRRGLINMLNGRYIFTWRNIREGGLELVYGDNPFVYRNREALARAYVVQEAVFARSEDEAFAVVAGEGFRPRDAVVIEGASPRDFRLAGPGARGVKAEPEITSYSDHEVVVEVDMPYNGFLVLSDTYYPGWTAEDNGEETRIYRANYLVRAVYLERGGHRVRFSYNPASFRHGRIISLVFLGVALLLFVAGGRRTRSFFALPGEGAAPGQWAKLAILAVLAALIILSFIFEPGNWRDAFMTLHIR